MLRFQIMYQAGRNQPKEHPKTSFANRTTREQSAHGALRLSHGALRKRRFSTMSGDWSEVPAHRS
jgi:hypothetical protein